MQMSPTYGSQCIMSRGRSGSQIIRRRLLELHGSAVLARSRSPVLGFIHMLLRLKEYAGLQRALTTGMLAFKLVPPAVKDPVLKSHMSTGTIATLESNESSESSTSQKRPELPGRDELRAAIAIFRAGKGCEIPNFKGSYLGRFPLVSADFWTRDHLSERSRSVNGFSGTRARGTPTLKRR